MGASFVLVLVLVNGGTCCADSEPRIGIEQGDFYDYCQAVRRTIREVLEEFRSARIPKEYLFDLFPPLRPREFSIASSVHVRVIIRSRAHHRPAD